MINPLLNEADFFDRQQRFGWIKLKKYKKSVDRKLKTWYYIRVADADIWKELEKINKKVLDKIKSNWYNKQAASRETTANNLDN